MSLESGDDDDDGDADSEVPFYSVCVHHTKHRPVHTADQKCGKQKTGQDSKRKEEQILTSVSHELNMCSR